MLVIIVVWGVLLAITMPMLRRARDESTGVACFSSLRQSSQSLMRFSLDHADLPPAAKRHATSPAESPTDARGLFSAPGCWLDVNYFIHDAWTVPLVFAYGENEESWVCPTLSEEDRTGRSTSGAYRGVHPLLSTYRISQVFFAAPRYWRPGALQSAHDLGPQRLTTIAFPSSKVILAETWLLHGPASTLPGQSARPARTPAAFTDGSVRGVRAEDFRTPVPNSLALNNSHPLLSTIDGVLGVDE